MKVKELASLKLVVARPHDTLEMIEKKMSDHQLHALPILDHDGKAIGIVTSSDCTSDLPPNTAVADLMTDQVYEIEAGASAREAARTMRDLGVHHLVVTEDRRAIGMLSSFDLLKALEVG